MEDHNLGYRKALFHWYTQTVLYLNCTDMVQSVAAHFDFPVYLNPETAFLILPTVYCQLVSQNSVHGVVLVGSFNVRASFMIEVFYFL